MTSVLGELGKHAFSDIISMGVSFVFTKLFYPRATLIRRPFHIRQKGNLSFASGFTTGRGCRFEMFEDGAIKLGRNCHIGDNVHFAALRLIEVGDDCLMASKVFISDLSHGSYGVDGCNPDLPPNDRPLVGSPVIIGNNVWIGENVCILQGVTIGSGTVVGANATVSRDLPERCIAVGSPARPIKRFDDVSETWVRCG
ncbi:MULTISPECIES: DapH/DapD/GlmU-related protein [unclassified Adlercreutzia]|uniref:DapH/DapD/GlmU-related protein n=1 Tax=unclassified Adlercreutzia TaxID=2636013 RepID=UPI00197E04DF|nr:MULTISPECIES: DapH/DapD/GlmU-related protein [unclassified Adlercreutzia]